MDAARLSLELGESSLHPMHRFVCESPAVDREVLLEGKVVDGVRTLLLYVAGDPAAYEAALVERTSVTDYDVTTVEDGCYCYVRGPNRAADAALFGAFDRETVVVVSPVEFRPDRTVGLTLVGPPADLRAALAALPDDVAVTVERVGDYGVRVGDGASGLTDRQREALATARERGYYAVPRETGIEAVAADLDCAVSTASALLRRAERTLVTEALP
jgi:hypothetical protein